MTISTTEEPKRGRGRPRNDQVSVATQLAGMITGSIAPPTKAPKEFLRVSDLVNAYGMSRMTISRMVKGGRFPQPRRMGGNVIWLRTEIEAWALSLPIGRGTTPAGILEKSIASPKRAARKAAKALAA